MRKRQRAEHRKRKILKLDEEGVSLGLFTYYVRSYGSLGHAIHVHCNTGFHLVVGGGGGRAGEAPPSLPKREEGDRERDGGILVDTSKNTRCT